MKAVKTRITMLGALAASLAGAAAIAFAQGGFNPAEMARKALQEPFVGLTADGKPEPGLFEIRSTGITVQPVIDSARSFLGSLDPDQRSRATFAIDDSEWRNWANIHRFPRKGVSLQEMNATQKERAYALLRASLSAKGYETARDIMRLNHHLGELVDNFNEYGEFLYWFIVFGDPGGQEPWGWQIEGHHLIVNYFVLGDQVVMTPAFMGSEPVRAETGKYRGVSVFQAEQDAGLKFMQSLSPEQQRVARIGMKEGRQENLAEMFKDNIRIPFGGLPASSLGEEHRARLTDLIGMFARNIRDGHAEIKMEEVKAHLDRTYFAWIGEVGPDAVFYYRIHSPVIFIEFDHQGPIALDGPWGEPTRRHIHTVVRTPNGNDYGKELLRQHYHKHADHPGHRHR